MFQLTPTATDCKVEMTIERINEDDNDEMVKWNSFKVCQIGKILLNRDFTWLNRYKLFGTLHPAVKHFKTVCAMELLQ